MSSQRSNKTYFVTGGASGLGQATVRLLAAQGANVVIADKNTEEGKALEIELGSRTLFVETNVIAEESVKNAMRTAKQTFGNLNGVINCAGIGSAFLTVDKNGKKHDAGIFDFVIKVNLYGTFNCCTEGAQIMHGQEPDATGDRGVLINVASIAAFDGQKGQLAYAAAKSAIVGMSLPMARDLGKLGIRVMCIAPGVIETPMGSSMPKKVKDALAKAVPYPKRFGTAEEFASLVAHIIDNPYLNGEVIRMDGGLRMPSL